jgi:hypothetical protein
MRFGRSTRVLISVVFQFSRAFATGIWFMRYRLFSKAPWA